MPPPPACYRRPRRPRPSNVAWFPRHRSAAQSRSAQASRQTSRSLLVVLGDLPATPAEAFDSYQLARFHLGRQGQGHHHLRFIVCDEVGGIGCPACTVTSFLGSVMTHFSELPCSPLAPSPPGRTGRAGCADRAAGLPRPRRSAPTAPVAPAGPGPPSAPGAPLPPPPPQAPSNKLRIKGGAMWRVFRIVRTVYDFPWVS